MRSDPASARNTIDVRTVADAGHPAANLLDVAYSAPVSTTVPDETMVRTVEWRNGTVVMIDQRLLPAQQVYRVCRDYREVARAIKDMVIRGAPAIGVAAAFGIALGMRQSRRDLPRSFERICQTFAATRPTAVNLFWAIERMRRAFTRARSESVQEMRDALLREAKSIHAEDIAANRALGQHGAALIPHG